MSTEKIKRKRIVVTINQKLEALKRIDDGAMLCEVAREYGVSPNTVGDWKRSRKSIEEYMSQKLSAVERKSMKPAVYPKTDQAVYTWIQQQQGQGKYVSGPTIMAKAKELSRQFPEENKFVSSEGWLAKWKTRYGIHLSGEKVSAEHISPVTFCTAELKDETRNSIEEESNIKQEELQEEEESDLVSSAAAYEALETALKFVEQQPSATPADIYVLKKWKDYAALQLT